MKLPASTEWLLHSATTLAQLRPGVTASAAQLAEYYDLPAPYLAKQLQALVRAGVLAAMMADAHEAWRRSLAGVTLADVVDTLPRTAPTRTRSLLAR